MRLKALIENNVKFELRKKGCTFIRINWKKNLCHFLDPLGHKRTELVVNKKEHGNTNKQAGVH